jgi:hypothetical protein
MYVQLVIIFLGVGGEGVWEVGGGDGELFLFLKLFKIPMCEQTLNKITDLNRIEFTNKTVVGYGANNMVTDLSEI